MAHKRIRSIWIWLGTAGALLLLALGAYAVVVVRFYTADPSPKVDYAEQLRERLPSGGEPA